MVLIKQQVESIGRGAFVQFQMCTNLQTYLYLDTLAMIAYILITIIIYLSYSYINQETALLI